MSEKTVVGFWFLVVDSPERTVVSYWLLVASWLTALWAGWFI